MKGIAFSVFGNFLGFFFYISRLPVLSQFFILAFFSFSAPYLLQLYISFEF